MKEKEVVRFHVLGATGYIGNKPPTKGKEVKKNNVKPLYPLGVGINKKTDSPTLTDVEYQNIQEMARKKKHLLPTQFNGRIIETKSNTKDVTEGIAEGVGTDAVRKTKKVKPLIPKI